MRRFSNRNHDHSTVRVEIVEIFANSKHSAIATDVSLESSINAGLGQSMLEQMPSGHTHFDG
jgi:hypothetical protein